MPIEGPDQRPCFAYSTSGHRCSLHAGHAGDHEHVIVFSDDEVWQPAGAPVIPQPPLWPPQGLEVVPPLPQGSGVCIICEHAHHPEGKCGADDGGYDCDCMNSVED